MLAPASNPRPRSSQIVVRRFMMDIKTMDRAEGCQKTENFAVLSQFAG
jgi:hypothetical protein